MNTLTDTDEGKARPSVWAVYVTSGIFVAVGAVAVYMCFLGVLEFPTIPPEETGTQAFLVVYFGLWGAVGLVTAVATSLLRPWAWWLGSVWGYLIGLSGFPLLFARAHESLFGSDRFFLELDEVLYQVLVPLAVAVFIVWTLNTRRWLFFPPKPESAE